MIKKFEQYIKEDLGLILMMRYLKTFETYNNDHKATNRLLTEFVPTYKDFEPTNLKTFTGYKIAEKINLNYYSVVSGIFRYQTGSIDHKSYSSLYRKNPRFFNEHLLNRLSVFTTKKDAIEALEKAMGTIKNWSSGHNKLALMEITISDDIERAKLSNNSVENREVYIGGRIDRVREIEIIG